MKIRPGRKRRVLGDVGENIGKVGDVGENVGEAGENIGIHVHSRISGVDPRWC